jgi:uncharacterized membrane protein YidH (DUF202 family)
MVIIMLLLCLVCLVCLIIGNKKPNLVIRWGDSEKKTRKNVFKYYGISLIVAFCLYGILGSLKKSETPIIILFLLCLICLYCILMGLIEPNLVIRWGDSEKKTRKNVFKYYGMSLIVAFTLIIVFAGMESAVLSNKNNTTKTTSSNTQNEEVKKAEADKKAEEIKLLQEKYKPLLESNKVYDAMNDEERANADSLITDWSKFEQEFKTSYQAQKDSIEKSKNEYVAKWKAEQEAKKAEEEKTSYDTGITYKQLARTPDDYKGKKSKFSGKVVQVIEGDGETELRIAVGGDYDTILFVAYKNEITSIRILENDYVTVRGKSAGIYKYQSTISGQISVPSMLVDKIELSK